MLHTIRIFFVLIIFISCNLISEKELFAEDFDPKKFDIERGKKVFIRKAQCGICHGWDGAGTGRHPRSLAATAPNIREFVSDYELLREVIACGRPYTVMPYHDRMAYKDDRCYGMTIDDFEESDLKPVKGYSTLREKDIDDLVAFIMIKMIGAGKTTKEQCEDTFKPGHRNCQNF